VVADDRVGVPDHPLGEDPVEIERDDDRDLLPEDLPCLFEELPLRIPFGRAGHRAVHAEDHAVGRQRPAQGVEELSLDAAPCRRGERPAGGDEAGAVRRHRFDSGGAREDVEDAADLGADLRVIVEEGRSVADVEVVGGARVRVEGRHLLLALSDEDPGHGGDPLRRKRWRNRRPEGGRYHPGRRS
jgi:hypothetical protein